MNCVINGKLTGDSCFGCEVKFRECDLHKLLHPHICSTCGRSEWRKFLLSRGCHPLLKNNKWLERD